MKRTSDMADASSAAADKLYRVRHSLAHVMAQAVLEVRPQAKLAFGPPIDTGFYYDFDLGEPLSTDDLEDIEERMRRIIKERQEFVEIKRSADEAVQWLEDQNEPYKVEYAKELIEGGESEIGFYRNGPFEDMCRGPHVKHTGELPAQAFALDSIAGAYWRGDEKRPQLTRIYALAFEDKKALKAFQEQRRLAKERDHRKLGQELDLFTISDRVGPGLVLWMPNGTVLRDALETFAKEIEFRAGYQRVATPHITKENLYITSGHLPYYKESMFPPMQLEDEEPYYLKPMNCPHHHMIYRARPRSYRDLPLRLAEYGTCYRYEESGALSGLLRVRMLSMNDAHIYCRPDQLREEFRAVLEMHEFYYKKFRLSDYWMRLSLHDDQHPDKYVDDPEAWAYSERIIREVLDEMQIRYDEASGEAAFYGPKVDFQIRNVVGREETASTNQLDFAMPERFDLTYVAEDGKEHRPYIIHRAPLGTHERFLAFLIEHFGGAFPSWMAPVQVKVIPVGAAFMEYAQQTAAMLRETLVRVQVDESDESFNKKIRNAVTRKTPNMLIVGANEQEQETVTWRRYAVREQQTLPRAQFADILATMIRDRVMDNFADEALPS
ncbi:MAG: threonine--tRNA ligase [Bdellovibrionales bacterium]|nr:threonine--tRNA ligase [Bdellovibrionales bacterium]